MSILAPIGSFFLDIIETFVFAVSIFLVVYLFIMQPHQVDGQSMMPNFINGEYILTDKVSYKIGEPARGDVIVFHAPEGAHCPKGTNCDFIKRILGLPGEEIRVENGDIKINGEVLDETYIADDVKTEAGEFSRGRVINLGSDEYFAVGDNRPFSSDSRSWGPITKQDIVGKAFFVYWPVTSVGLIPKVSY